MNDKEKRFIAAVEGALSAQRAWNARGYSFQTMKEYYAQLLALAKKHKVSTKWLEKVHKDITDEFEMASKDKSEGPMREEDECRISILDIFFTEAFVDVFRNISDKAAS